MRKKRFHSLKKNFSLGPGASNAMCVKKTKKAAIGNLKIRSIAYCALKITEIGFNSKGNKMSRHILLTCFEYRIRYGVIHLPEVPDEASNPLAPLEIEKN